MLLVFPSWSSLGFPQIPTASWKLPGQLGPLLPLQPLQLQPWCFCLLTVAVAVVVVRGSVQPVGPANLVQALSLQQAATKRGSTCLQLGNA